MSQPISVVVPVYDGVTQLDFTGPHQFLSRTPDLHVRVASLGGEPVTADRLTFSNLDDLAAIESCDVLLVPGGGGCLAAIENDLFVKEIARLGATARYLTSVCTGSLILGAAGFLRGRRAACHWAWRELLPVFGAIVAEGRLVRDGTILSVGRKLDLPLPDSPAVRDAYAHAEAESQPWLFNHVMRSWLYSAKLAQSRGLAPDAELVAVAVLLHDLGLARSGAPDRRFEVVGADIGRAFALSHDMGERRAEVVWDSIALHPTPSIAQHKGADVACCQNGIACDYGGLGYQELSDDIKKVILSAYPRLDMKNMLTTCLCGIAKNHPSTTRDNFIADFGIKYIPGYTHVSSVDFLHQAPFAE